MIRASHLAKGLDSDVGCQPCLPVNTHSHTWYHSVPSEQGSVVGVALQLGLQRHALFAQLSEFSGSGQNVTYVAVAR